MSQQEAETQQWRYAILRRPTFRGQLAMQRAIFGGIGPGLWASLNVRDTGALSCDGISHEGPDFQLTELDLVEVRGMKATRHRHKLLVLEPST